MNASNSLSLILRSTHFEGRLTILLRSMRAFVKLRLEASHDQKVWRWPRRCCWPKYIFSVWSQIIYQKSCQFRWNIACHPNFIWLQIIQKQLKLDWKYFQITSLWVNWVNWVNWVTMSQNLKFHKIPNGISQSIYCFRLNSQMKFPEKNDSSWHDLKIFLHFKYIFNW